MEGTIRQEFQEVQFGGQRMNIGGDEAHLYLLSVHAFGVPRPKGGAAKDAEVKERG